MWMQAMGFSGKQVAEAGKTIGMGRSTALLCHSGKRRLTKTERLAMAAAVSQSSPWSPEHHDEIVAGGKVMIAARQAFAARPCSSGNIRLSVRHPQSGPYPCPTAL